jgi:hypothetical protein
MEVSMCLSTNETLKKTSYLQINYKLIKIQLKVN